MRVAALQGGWEAAQAGPGNFWVLDLGLPMKGTAEYDGVAPLAPLCGERLKSLPAAFAGVPPTLS